MYRKYGIIPEILGVIMALLFCVNSGIFQTMQDLGPGLAILIALIFTALGSFIGVLVAFVIGTVLPFKYVYAGMLELTPMKIGAKEFFIGSGTKPGSQKQYLFLCRDDKTGKIKFYSVYADQTVIHTDAKTARILIYTRTFKKDWYKYFAYPSFGIKYEIYVPENMIMEDIFW